MLGTVTFTYMPGTGKNVETSYLNNYDEVLDMLAYAQNRDVVESVKFKFNSDDSLNN